MLFRSEVGPIKYIAALIYGDNPDQNILERAVRWVIILIVIVFDPLALTLILAGNQQLEWARKGRGGWVHDDEEKNVPAEPTQDLVVTNSIPTDNTPIVTPVVEEHPLTQEEREAKEQQELEQFFWRGRMIAKALDADEDARRVQEGNEAIAKTQEEREIDQFLEQNWADMAEEIAMQEAEYERQKQQQAEQYRVQQEALEALAAEFDKVNSELEQEKTRNEDLIETLASAEQIKTDLKAALDGTTAKNTELSETNQGLGQDLTRATQTVLLLQSQLDTSNQKINELQGWVDQLQSDLKAAIQLAQERNDALTALQAQLPPPPPIVVTEVVEEVPVATTMTVEDHDTTVGAELGFTERYFSHKVTADEGTGSNADFGTAFPEDPAKGDIYLRVDFLPNRMYKWNGLKWIEVDKKLNDQLSYNTAYIEHILERLRSGEYDIDDLSESERSELEQYLKRQNETL